MAEVFGYTDDSDVIAVEPCGWTEDVCDEDDLCMSAAAGDELPLTPEDGAGNYQIAQDRV